MIAFSCPGCGKQLKVKDELAGKKGKCTHCQSVVTVPALAPQAPSWHGNAPAEPRTLPPAAAAAQPEAPGRTPGRVGPAEPETLLRGAAALQTAFPAAAATGANPEHYDFLNPPQQADEIGRLGGYRVLKILGAGGMGVVFQAEDTTLKRKVALKAMLPALAASGSAKQRFLREAQTAAAIEHDHIVPIYQVGEDRGVPFIAMPLLKGESLEQRLSRPPRLPLPEVLRIGRETAQGLAAAHAAGLIHRDIKPANLWLEAETGRVKILDFGLARASSDNARLTQQGAIMGTPAYMAPEQASGETVDARADLFSLGCVLYQISTGQLPFGGRDAISTLMAVATEEPRPPAELNPALPPGLSALVMQLLAKNPQDRPASAQEVIQALADVRQLNVVRRASVAPRPTEVPPRAVSVAARTYSLDEEDGAGPPPTIMGLSRGLFLGLAIGLGAGLVALILVVVVALAGRKPTPAQPVAPVAENTPPAAGAPAVHVMPVPPPPFPAPPPGPAAREYGPEETVTLTVTGVPDLATQKAIEAKLAAWTDEPGNHRLRATAAGNVLRVSLAPVKDPRALAMKIDFGQVTGVKDRLIDVTVKPAAAAGPAPVRIRLPTKEEAIARALTELTSADAARQKAAAARLVRLHSHEVNEEVARTFEGLLASAEPQLRRAAAQGLAAWGRSDSVPPLLKLLSDTNKEVRAAALLALGKLHDERAAEPVAARLGQDPEAAAALKEMGPVAEKAVLALFRGPGPSLRLEACRVLAIIASTRETVETLRATMRNKRDPQLAQAATLAFQHDAIVVQALHDVQDPFPNKRGAALQTLARLEPNARRGEVARALEDLAGRHDPFNQEQVCRALAVWGTPETVPALIRLVDHQARLPKNGPIYAALAKFKDERAVDAIVPGLTNFFDGAAARQALKDLGEVGEWQLHKYLQDRNPELRKEVCGILQVVGTADSLPALRAAALDPAPPVAQAAEAAIQAIEAAGAAPR